MKQTILTKIICIVLTTATTSIMNAMELSVPAEKPTINVTLHLQPLAKTDIEGVDNEKFNIADERACKQLGIAWEKGKNLYYVKNAIFKNTPEDEDLCWKNQCWKNQHPKSLRFPGSLPVAFVRDLQQKKSITHELENFKVTFNLAGIKETKHHAASTKTPEKIQITEQKSTNVPNKSDAQLNQKSIPAENKTNVVKTIEVTITLRDYITKKESELPTNTFSDVDDKKRCEGLGLNWSKEDGIVTVCYAQYKSSDDQNNYSFFSNTPIELKEFKGIDYFPAALPLRYVRSLQNGPVTLEKTNVASEKIRITITADKIPSLPFSTQAKLFIGATFVGIGSVIAYLIAYKDVLNAPQIIKIVDFIRNFSNR